jgi:hypothetical protein
MSPLTKTGRTSQPSERPAILPTASSRACILIILITALFAKVSSGQTLNWGSLTNSTIVDSNGLVLDNTFLFELGAFDAGFTPEQSNIGDWSMHWHVLSVANYSYNPTDLGYFTGTVNLQDVPGYATIFEGLTAFIWVRNASLTEQFLGSTASWVMPTLDTGCCPTGVTTWSVSDLVSDTPVWGGHDNLQGGGNYTAPGPFDLQTHAIPEPGTCLMALLGCCAALMRRKRND